MLQQIWKNRGYGCFQLAVAVAFFSCLCFTNYSLSTWIFLKCGDSLWYFLPTLLVTTCSISLFIYFAVVYVARSYVGKLVSSLETMDLVEFSCLMARYKEVIYSERKALVNVENPVCLICYEYPAWTITQPCLHKVMCGRCAWKYIATCIKDQQTLRCILCRTEAEEYSGDVTIELNDLNMTEFQQLLNNKNTIQADISRKQRTFSYIQNDVVPCVT